MPTQIKLMLTLRNGSFNTIKTSRKGLNKFEAVMKSVLALIQNESPLITQAVMRDLQSRATHSTSRIKMKSAIEIGDEFNASTASAIDALTNLTGADAISALATDDKRRQPLKKLNRALAKEDFCLDVEIDQYCLPPIKHLALAPHACIDSPWDGDLILRVTNWNTESCVIEGRSENFDKIMIDLRQRPHLFNKLMKQQAPFVHVLGGRGRINPSGLRILQHQSILCVFHNELPASLQLHFAGDDEAT